MGHELPHRNTTEAAQLRTGLPVPPAPLPTLAGRAGPGCLVRHRRPPRLGVVLYARDQRLARGQGGRGGLSQADAGLYRPPGKGLERARRLQRRQYQRQVCQERLRHPHLGRHQDPEEPVGGLRPKQRSPVQGPRPQGDAALEKIATWDDRGRCWLKCGMGALRADGSTVPNGWNAQPAPLVEPLVTYYLATRDAEGLRFAKAYAEGMIGNCQPDGIRFHSDGSVTGGFSFGPHSHATMHAVWGVAHLGVVTGDPRYTEFARGVWDWMLKRGTGTGWFPAGPDNCNETCCISDMMSIAGLLGQAGHQDYFDCLERYLRNAISNLQFVMTPDFETYYRERNASSPPEAVAARSAEHTS